MIVILCECYANEGFGEMIVENWKRKIVHMEGVTKLEKKMKGIEQTGARKVLVIIDSEEGTSMGKYIKNALRKISQNKSISTYTLKSNRNIELRECVSSTQKLLIVLFRPYIEEAFIKLYDPQLKVCPSRYKSREGKELIKKVIKEKEPREIEEIKRKLKLFFQVNDS